MQITKPNMVQLNNFFDNSTKSNHKKMLSLSTDHKHKLDEGKNDPVIAELADMIKAPYDDFQQTYALVVSNYGYYQGKTQQTESLYVDLNYNSKRWDIAVQNSYMDDTPEYTMIFPNKRGTFQKGTYETRLEAVRALEMSLVRFPDLATVLADVQAFRQKIETSRAEQQAIEKRDQDLRIALEEKRTALAKVMHRIFGKLLFIYGDQYTRIEAYYELQYFQRSASAANSDFKIIPANSRVKAMDGIFKETDQFVLSNKGNVPLGFFVTDDELSPTPADMTILQANESQVYSLAELTDGKSTRLLLVVNLSGEQARFSANIVANDSTN